MKSTNVLQGTLLVAVSAISFGLMPIFTKIAYADGTDTHSLLCVRFFVAAVFMFSLMRIRKIPLPDKRDALAFFMLGALGYVGQSSCFFAALQYASPSIVSLLLYTYPAMVMIGAFLFLKERITVKKIFSLLLAFLGTVTIIGKHFTVNKEGVILSVMAALFYSAYILVSAKTAKKGMEIPAAAFIILGAAAVFGTLSILWGLTLPSHAAGLSAAVMIALVSTALAFWSFFAGMAKIGPSAASLVSTLEPIVTILASVFILSEKLTANIILGGLLVLAALIITAISPKKGKTLLAAPHLRQGWYRLF